MLRMAKFTVETYPSAAAFLAIAERAEGVVVTDVRMPEIDGMELVQRLRALQVGIPIIVMTGHGDIPLAVEAMKAGVVDFIEKPYDGERMLGAVRAALDQQRGAGRARRRAGRIPAPDRDAVAA